MTSWPRSVKIFGYEYWERTDPTHSGVRFCASWATTQEHVDALRAAVRHCRKNNIYLINIPRP